MDLQDAAKFLDAQLPDYDRATNIAVSLIESILRQEGIDYLSVTGRTKNRESALEKFIRKSYDDICKQMTDLSGIRIITYLDDQVRRISEVVEQAFAVDRQNSLDRSQILGDDRVGYRSVHFICTLGKSRRGIIEYRSLCDIPFEIQVRTVLQHAWAELTHDRSYKFGKTLPSHLQRKLNLYAGMLEIVDGAFDEIAKSVDEYANTLKSESRQKLRDEPINSISIAEFLNKIAAENGLDLAAIPATEETGTMIGLTNFGITSIGDLESLFTPEYIEVVKKYDLERPTRPLISFAMCYNDLEKRLKTAERPQRFRAASRKALEEKYGQAKVERLLKQYKATVVDPSKTAR